MVGTIGTIVASVCSARSFRAILAKAADWRNGPLVVVGCLLATCDRKLEVRARRGDLWGFLAALEVAHVVESPVSLARERFRESLVPTITIQGAVGCIALRRRTLQRPALRRQREAAAAKRAVRVTIGMGLWLGCWWRWRWRCGERGRWGVRSNCSACLVHAIARTLSQQTIPNHSSMHGSPVSQRPSEVPNDEASFGRSAPWSQPWGIPDETMDWGG